MCSHYYVSCCHGYCVTTPTAQSYARYGPSQGYYWKFPGDSGIIITIIIFIIILLITEETTSQTTSKTKNEPSEMQRKRVDGLLLELIKQFPPKVVQPKEDGKPLPSTMICM